MHGTYSGMDSGRKMKELSYKLEDLRTKRNLVESKISLHMKTLSSFDLVRSQGKDNLFTALQLQNEKARERNQKLVNDISVALNEITSSFVYSTKSEFGSKDSLKRAKLDYCAAVETNRLLSHRVRTIKLEEKAQSLRQEKLASLQRREKLQKEMLREDEARAHFDAEKRDLMHLIAEEKKDLMRAKKNEIMRSQLNQRLSEEVLTEVIIKYVVVLFK